MTEFAHPSRRSICLAGGGVLVLGLTACTRPVVQEVASIVLEAYTHSSLLGKLGGYTVALVAEQAGLFDVQTAEAQPPATSGTPQTSQTQQIRGAGKVVYDDFMRIDAAYRLVYEDAIPEFRATVTNTTQETINVGAVTCVACSSSGEVLETIPSDEYVNLEPGQSTTLEQAFKFTHLSKANLGYVRLETKYNQTANPLTQPLFAIAAKSALTAV